MGRKYDNGSESPKVVNFRIRIQIARNSASTEGVAKELESACALDPERVAKFPATLIITSRMNRIVVRTFCAKSFGFESYSYRELQESL